MRLVIGVGFLLHGLAKWSHGPAAFGRLLQYLLETSYALTGLNLPASNDRLGSP